MSSWFGEAWDAQQEEEDPFLNAGDVPVPAGQPQTAPAPLNPNAGGFRDPTYNPANVTPGGVYAPNPDLGIFDYERANPQVPVVSPFLQEAVPWAINSVPGIREASALSQVFGGPDVGQTVSDLYGGDYGAADIAMIFAPGVGDVPVDDLYRGLRSAPGMVDNVVRGAFPEPNVFGANYGAGIPPMNPMGGENVFGPGVHGGGLPIPPATQPEDLMDTLARSIEARGGTPPVFDAPAPPPAPYPSIPEGTMGEMFPDVVREQGIDPRSPAARMGAPLAYDPQFMGPPPGVSDVVPPPQAVDDTAQQMRDAFANVRREEDALTGGAVSSPPPESPVPTLSGSTTAPPASLTPEETRLPVPFVGPEGGVIQGEGFTMRSPTTEELVGSISNRMGREVSPEEMEWIGNRVNMARPEPQNITPGRGQSPDLAPENRVGDIDPGRYRTNVLDWLNLPRTLMAGADLSYPLRQGALLIRHGEDFAKSFGSMIRAVADGNYADEVYRAIENSPYRDLKGKLDITPLSGGSLSAREENFVSRLVENIPVYREMQRGTNVFINKLRSDVADNFIEKMMEWVDQGKMTDAAARADIDKYMNYLNRATGRGTLGQFDAAAVPLGQVFFSIRNALSKPQAAGYLIDRPFSPVWNEAAKDWAGFIGLGAATLYLADKAGAEVNLNPKSTDFGRIKVGNQSIDVWAGVQPLVRSVYQIATGEKVSSTGRKSDIAAEKVIIDFLRNKLSPQAGAVADFAWPQDFRPPPGANLETVLKFAAPLFAQDIYKAVDQDGLTGGMLVAPSFFGVGVQTRNPPSAGGQRVEALNATLTNDANLSGLPQQVADILKGQEWNDLTTKEQRAILATLTDDQRKQIEGYEAQLRKENNPFQLNRDERTARETAAKELKDEYGPAFDRLYAEWLKGDKDPYEIAKLISQTNRDVNGAVNIARNMGPKLSESQGYQDAVKKIGGEPQENLVYTYGQGYFDIYDRYKTADGKPDYDRIERAQQAYIERIRQSDPQLAARVEYHVTRDASQDHPVVQLLNRLNDKLDVYYDQPEGTRTQYRREHPDIDAMFALRNGGDVYSQQAKELLSKWAPERAVGIRR